MRIERLKLKNFRCYDALDIDFDPRLTVIVGPNGRGKTAIFDALAIGLEPYLREFEVAGHNICPKDVRRVPVYNRETGHIEGMQTNYPAAVELTGTAGGAGFACVRRLLSGDAVQDEAEQLTAYAKGLTQEAADAMVVLPVLAYYGTQRIWVDSHLMEQTEGALTQRSIGYDDCLEPSSSYNTFGRWFRRITQSAHNEVQYNEELKRNLMMKNAIQRAIDVCLESTGLRDLYYNYKLQCFVVSHPDMGEMIVDDLSDGFRSIISMLADLAYRMARLNPQLGEDAVTETPGIVLIDEVDMHLHPQWQQTVLVDLQRAFPKVQFIVTTHSPQVLSSVPAQSIRVLVWGRQFEGVRHVDFSLGANSNQLLQDIQNVDPRPQSLPIVQDLKRYLQLVSEDAWDSDEALALRKKLDAWSHGQEPALLRADMDIRMRSFRRRKK